MNYFEKKANKIVDSFSKKILSAGSPAEDWLRRQIANALEQAVADARRLTPDEVERSCRSELLWIERFRQERDLALEEAAKACLLHYEECKSKDLAFCPKMIADEIRALKAKP